MAIQKIMGGSERLPRQREWEEPQRKKAVQGFKLPFRELGQAAEALGTAARSGARMEQALEGKAQDVNRFTVVDMAAPKEADSPAPLPAAERENGFRLPGVEKGVTELARQTGDITGKTAMAVQTSSGQSTAPAVFGTEAEQPSAFRLPAVLKPAQAVGSAEWRLGLTERTPEELQAERVRNLTYSIVQELEQELKAYRENVRIPLRAGSGYAAAELDTDSEEYRQRTALERQVSYWRNQMEIANKQVAQAKDQAQFDRDMAQIRAMTENQRQALKVLSDAKRNTPQLSRDAAEWMGLDVEGVILNSNEAMQCLTESGFSQQRIAELVQTFSRDENAEKMEDIRRKAQQMANDADLSGLGAILADLGVAFGGLTGTLDRGMTSIEDLFDPARDYYSSMDTNLPGYMLGEFGTAYRAEYRKLLSEGNTPGTEQVATLLGEVISWVDPNCDRAEVEESTRKCLGGMKAAGYDMFNTGKDLAIAYFTFGKYLPAVAGMNVFTDTVQDAGRRGASERQALAAGFANAAVGYFLGKGSMGLLQGLALPANDLEMIKNAFARGGTVTTAGLVASGARLLVDDMTMGQSSSYHLRVQEYCAEGFTQEQAETLAARDMFYSITLSSLKNGAAAAGLGMASDSGRILWNELNNGYGGFQGNPASGETGLTVPGTNGSAFPGSAGVNPGGFLGLPQGGAPGSPAPAANGAILSGNAAGSSGGMLGPEPAAGGENGLTAQGGGSAPAGNGAAAPQARREAEKMDESPVPSRESAALPAEDAGEAQDPRLAQAKRAELIKALLLREAAYNRYQDQVLLLAPAYGVKPESLTPETLRIMFDNSSQGEQWAEKIRQAEAMRTQALPPARQAVSLKQGQAGQPAPQNGQGNVIPFRLPQQAAQTRQGQAALQQLPVAGNNAMQLPGQTTPGNTAQGGPVLHLAQSQGSAILQTPQAYGGSAQQAPQMQGGIGVLTPPGQGGAALPGQQNQSGPAALQPQQGQAMPQGQQTGGSVEFQDPQKQGDMELQQNQAGNSLAEVESNLQKKLPNRAIEKFDSERYNKIILEYTTIDRDAVYKTAASGGKHYGVYRNATVKYKKLSLEKSIHSRTKQVLIHMEKILNPQRIIAEWDSLSQKERNDNINKWNEDLIRNAEQAEIEIKAWEDLYGDF